jgi:hypothetical protein
VSAWGGDWLGVRMDVSGRAPQVTVSANDWVALFTSRVTETHLILVVTPST